ncbi:PAS domain-containing protein [Qingshengfaniella alkalisoli]|uniref:PAS domain-containing protein n=1 Tax=Qingshengfaniella alkalisoli TaxID=2599296 RepID=A0A5B8IUG1_9RHOB|nr:PAS domain-containing protein [Qingshengfaniella alkalisoli]QDY69063.1 PAS domain-containing protein [Qingshengfaniella alkalisoli]
MNKLPTTPDNLFAFGSHRLMTPHHPAQELEHYWEELRGNATVPKRADIDPRRIADALEYAFIIERIAADVARFRVAGAHLTVLMGTEVRGIPLSTFFPPDERFAVSDILEHLFDRPAKCRMMLEPESRFFGGSAVSGEMILLPLQSDCGEISRAFGCLTTCGDINRTPCRFKIRTQQIEQLGLYRRRPPVFRPAPPPQSVPAFAEAAAPYDTTASPQSRTLPEYLRVVK